ncbi:MULTISPECIES: hypothetical protein [Amycolatopsis]|uniref:Uncharacterized protein n=1 Tax=Amycolatopsis echigonensis TaxID=2576905 RepID=A0A2N3WNH7_9PSEU|nr:MULTISPECIES: hypothetical protein [Amycolatopsis]MBB2498376.1 hypothetical protein [Amycolatopsis echigonensis]PKV95420.1 hypothetical protein ATK30_6340 [Amycolatopsis niigatensis]
MIASLWRILPGPAWVRAVLLAVLFAAACAGLWFGLYPLLDDWFMTTSPVLD